MRKRQVCDFVGNNYGSAAKNGEKCEKVKSSTCGFGKENDSNERKKRKIMCLSEEKKELTVRPKIRCGGGDREKYEDKGVQVGFSEGSYCRKEGLKNVTYKELFQKILYSKESTVNWLMDKGFLNKKRLCPECGGPMKLINVPKGRTSDLMQWSCRKGQHDLRLSVRHGSWFANANMTLEEITEITYLWCLGLSQVQIQELMGCSSNTVVDWFSFCREVCEVTLLKETENGKQIGGENIIVEIDESKFAKRKYHRGHEVKLGWVFGGRERDNSRNCFMDVVPVRSAETLITLIQKHVARGSIIYSDCWKAYDKLNTLGYKHFKVNHSENFKDPKTGCHTNGIEGDWQKVKHGSHMPQFGIKEAHLPGYLAVFIWRRKHEGSDKFLQFMQDASKLNGGYCRVVGCRHCPKY